VGRETNKQRRANQAATARERAAAARAAQLRQEQRSRAFRILSAVVAVAVVVAVIAVIAINHKGSNNVAGNRATASTSLLNNVTRVSDTTLTKVAAGSGVTPPQAVSGQAPLTSGGKPEVLYIGAEFCPYCAVERWSLASALSRFGTLSNVGTVSSSSVDVYPNTPSLDFRGATYTSKYLTFVPIENEDRDHKPLQAVSSAQNALWGKLTNGERTFPFIDFGNKAIAVGSPSNPRCSPA
jgi:hypothetical protein